MKKIKLRHILAAALFCMVMSIGFVCLADEQATVNVKNAVIRAAADPNSEKLGSVPQGQTVDVISQTTGTDGKKWYQVYVNGDKKGYIRGDLLKLKDGANVKSENPTPAVPAQNTDGMPKKGTVVNNDVRIRKGASTNDGVVATANRGMVVTVTGETKGGDGKNWYQISFTYNNKEITGFIRSDLVTFDNVPADVAQSQITGVENAGEGETGTGGEEQPSEPETLEEAPPAPAPQENKKEVTPMTADKEPYVMPGFTLFDLVDGGQKSPAYRNGSFYIIYGLRSDGEEGWFLFDSEKGVYTRYPYTVAGVETAGDKTVSILVAIALVAVIVVLVAVVGILMIKLLARSREDDYYGTGNGRGKKGYQDDELEDLEELELDDEGYKAPARSAGRVPVGGPPQGRYPQQGAVPQEQSQGRRPQPQSGNPPSRPRPSADEQPQGRQPQPQGGNPPSRPRPLADEQPQGRQSAGVQSQGRRPQPQGGNPPSRPRPSADEQPQGRQPQGSRPPGNGSPQPGGRPAAGSLPQGRQPQPHKRPPQNDKLPPQNGYKTKSPDQGDDDMEFMDI